MIKIPLKFQFTIKLDQHNHRPILVDWAQRAHFSSLDRLGRGPLTIDTCDLYFNSSKITKNHNIIKKIKDSNNFSKESNTIKLWNNVYFVVKIEYDIAESALNLMFNPFYLKKPKWCSHSVEPSTVKSSKVLRKLKLPPKRSAARCPHTRDSKVVHGWWNQFKFFVGMGLCPCTIKWLIVFQKN